MSAPLPGPVSGQVPGQPAEPLSGSLHAGDVPAQRRPADPLPDAAPDADLLAGYPVGRLLGEGAQCLVHEVTRPADGVRYALKIEAGARPRTTAATAFAREAALLARLPRGVAPRVHEVGVHDGRPYQVIELVPGRTLADVLRDGPLDVPAAVRLAADVCRAVGAVHRIGLVHRDLKPANIMVTPAGTARLLDFGLAAREGDTSGEGAAGTFAYAAPEQLGVLHRPVDGRADLYSLGIVLHECLTGALPFPDHDVGELLRMHAVAPPPPLPAHVPQPVADLVARLLAKDPDDRFADASSCLAAVTALAETLGIATTLAPSAGTAGHSGAVGHSGATGRSGDAADAGGDGDDRKDDDAGRGRRRELARLRTRWHRAGAGEPGIALVTGAPGAGKSWLAGQVAAIARHDGATVLHGKASPDDASPFAALRAVTSQVLDAAGAGTTDSATGTATEAAGLSAYAAAVAAGLVALAADRPVLLVLDDVQWLDAGTRAVLLALADELDQTPVPLLVLATARDDDASQPAVAELVHLLGDDLDTRLTVGPLEADAVLDVLAGALPGVQAGDRVVELLTSRCAGNTFLLLQYLRGITDAGLLRPHWGGWQLDEAGLDALELPTEVVGLVLARAGRLGEPVLDLLATAALLPGGFAAPLLAAVHDVPVGEVHQRLRLACDHGLVEPGPAGYRFVHDRVREALLARFEPESAAARHLRIADAVEAADPSDSNGSVGERVFALAHHLVHAGPPGAGGPDPDRLLRACVEAARLALATFAPGIAVDLLDHACRAVPAVPADVLVLHGLALQQEGRWAHAVERLEAALALTQDPLDRASVLADLADVHRSTWDEEAALDAVARGLAALDLPGATPTPASAAGTTAALVALALRPGALPRPRALAEHERRREQLASRLHEVAGYMETLQMRPGHVLHHGLRARARAARVGPGDQFARCEAAVATALAFLGLRSAAERAFLCAQASAQGPTARAMVAHYRGALAYLNGDDDGARWAAVLAEHGHALDAAVVCDVAASLHLNAILRGDVTEAVARYEEAERRLALGNITTSALSSLPPLTLALQGRHAEAGAARQEVMRLYDVANSPATIVARAMVELFVHHEQGETGPLFDDAARPLEELRLDPRIVLRSERIVYVTLAETRLRQLATARDEDRPRRVEQLDDALRRLARAATTADLADRLAICRAEQALVQGRPDEALRLLARRDTSSTVTPEAPMAAHRAAVVRAAALRERGRRAEARAQAVAAVDLAETFGWPHRAEQVRHDFRLGRRETRLARTTGATPHGTAMSATTGSSPSSATSTAPERQRLDALESVTRAAARVLDPGRLAAVVLDQALRILNAERGYLFAADAAGSLALLRGRDADGTDLDAPTGYSTTVVERAFATREALVVTGTEEGEALGSVSVVVHGLRSILAAPLLLEGRCLGVVYLDSRVARGIFSAHDAGILSALATHVATALETARAAQLEISARSAQRERDLADGLRGALEAMSRVRDPQLVLQLLVDEAPALVPGATALVLDADEASALDGTAGDGDATALPVEVAEVVASRTGVARVGSWLALPLTVRDEPRGALVLVSPEDAGPSADAPAAHRDVLATLVAQTMAVYESAELFERVQRLASLDELTGVANRRWFLADARGRVEAAGAEGRPVVAVMLDIDHFKSVNDTHGHPTGDDVIRLVAQRAAAVVGTAGVLGRYGGEEFAILLDAQNGNDPVDADGLAEQLRAAIADAPLDTRTGPLAVTVSVGVARCDGPADLEALLGRADRALYAAKTGGRNRVAHDD